MSARERARWNAAPEESTRARCVRRVRDTLALLQAWRRDAEWWAALSRPDADAAAAALEPDDRRRTVDDTGLDEIARALPAYTWLTNVAVEANTVVNTAVTDTTAVDTMPPALQFRVEGRTVDMQAYTRFLRQLESSPWIEEVMAVEAKTVVEKERPVTAFTIRATFTRADSAYIRTVPLSESVR